jgi:hypothetical protein
MNIVNKYVPDAVVSALNRAASSTKTATVRDVSSQLGIMQKKARWRIRFQRRDEATTSLWTAKMFLVISDISASAFGKPRQMKAGAKVKGMFFPGQFVATMESGHTGIFRRGTLEGRKYSARREKNYGIRGARMGLHNPGIIRQLSYRGNLSALPIDETKMKVRAQISENAWNNIKTIGEDTFLKRFNHEMERRLKV